MEEDEAPEETLQLPGARLPGRAPAFQAQSLCLSPVGPCFSPPPHHSMSCCPPVLPRLAREELGSWAVPSAPSGSQLVLVMAGATWLQAEGPPGVEAWPLSLVPIPLAPRMRCPGPAEAWLPSPGFPTRVIHGAHAVRLRGPCLPGPPPWRENSGALHPLDSSQAPAKSPSIALTFALNLAPYGPSSRESSSLGSAPARPLQPLSSPLHSTSSPDPPAQIMARQVERSAEDHFPRFNTKSNLPERKRAGLAGDFTFN